MAEAGDVVAVPVIDVGPLTASSTDPSYLAVVADIDAACRDVGFFSIANTGADFGVLDRLDAFSREFFALPIEEKDKIAMRHAGPAWRGWFPAGGELTSGVPDRKEGIYFGTELAADDPRVGAGLALHGQNLFPERPPELAALVLTWLDEMRTVADRVMGAISVALGFEREYFETTFTADPTILFRVFTYAPAPSAEPGWGVGEHTDYGLLTLLAQDSTGGLQVRSRDGWVEVEPRPETLVCNLGDMLELMTGGRYRSTPHRVVSPTSQHRLSFPYFFDPSFHAVVAPVVPAEEMNRVDTDRWDGASPLVFRGAYGDYLTSKVARVFPDLFDSLS